MKFTWTDDFDETIRRMALLNQSASQIGAVIGCSRNAVIGRASRRGIALSKLVVSNEPKVVRARELQTASRAGHAPPQHPRDIVTLAKISTPRVTDIGRRLFRPQVVYSAPAPAPAPPDPTSHAVDIFGLTSKTCRNPLGPKMEVARLYCGKPPKPGSPYCPTCHALNYAPRLPPTRATIDKRVSKFGGYLMAAE